MVEQMLTAIGLSKGATIGGFFGALASLKLIEGLGFWGRISAIFFGWVTAVFVTPLAILALDVTVSDRTELGIAFLLGVFGMSLLGATMKAIPELFTMLLSYVKGRWFK